MQLHSHLQPDPRTTLRVESLTKDLSTTREVTLGFGPRPCQMVPSALLSIYFTLEKEVPPTRTERLGHQPRQAAGNLGSGEVIMVEALDGGDDESPPHPAVICRVPHLQPRGAPLCSWRVTQPREFLLTADDIPHGGIQRSREQFKGKKIQL